MVLDPRSWILGGGEFENEGNSLEFPGKRRDTKDETLGDRNYETLGDLGPQN